MKNTKICSAIKKQAGLTMVESLLVLGVAAAVAVIGYAGYRASTGDVNTSAVGQDTVGMVAGIKRVWGASGNYTTVNGAGVNNAGLVIGTFKWDTATTSVIDGLGNPVAFDGATSKFAILLGPYSKEDCLKVVPALTSLAYDINVGAAAALTGGNVGTVTGGSAYKAGPVINQDNLSAGCENGAAKIAIEIR
jgi:type II secretory pathway pseudopilin PulG